MPFTEKFVRAWLRRIGPALESGSLQHERSAQDVVGEIMTAAETPRVTVRMRRVAGMDCAWIAPEKQAFSGVMLYLHGGGYTCGSMEYAKGVGSMLAAKCGVRVFCPAYRLAPEARFPAALDDALAAYRYVLSCGFKPEEIMLCGESAGGGLCYCLCLKLKELRMQQPSGVIAISPWTDLTASGASYETNKGKDPTLSKEKLCFYAEQYAENPRDPLVSPLLGDVRGLPPSLLFAAGAELLLDDSVRMHEKLEQAGCESKLIVSPGLWHAYVLYGLREYSRRDTATMTAFLRAHLRQKEKTRWMRLDNAAKIFPASRRKNWANLFRLSVELSEEIDPLVLQAALDATVKRFPSIAVRLRGGLFWYYLEEIPFAPEVRQEKTGPLRRMGEREVSQCAFRVLYYKNRISAEFFHALTDGNGGLVFLKTLAAEYLFQRYGAEIPCEDGVLSRREAPKPGETEDSFLRYAGEMGSGRSEPAAYRARGVREPDGFLHVTCGTLDSAAVCAAAKEYGATVTAFLAAVLLDALLEMQRECAHGKQKRLPVRVLIPVNLRKLFASETLRNFVMVVGAGVDPRMGEYTFRQLVDAVRCQMGVAITPQNMRAAFTTNVKSEKSMALRIAPLPLKNLVMKLVFDIVGERAGSLTLSNMGEIALPEEMRPYVRRFDFVLSAQANAPYNCSVCSYDGKLRLNLVRNSIDPELERRFFRRLVKLGLHVTIESNSR